MLNPRDVLIYLSLKNNGDWKAIYSQIKKQERLNSEEVVEVNSTIKSKVITIFDEEYPKYLKNIVYPPLVLFYHGDISLLQNCNRRLGIVGSRANSPQGELITTKIVNELPENVTIVSGLAIGIDTIAHRAAINSNKKTIAVLGCGINLCYTTSNKDVYEEIKENHLVISEYPNLTEPKPENFPFRNRIIAGIAESLLVTEAKIPSGTSITVHFALNEGKDIMCVPYLPQDVSGCNKLIQDGAVLVTNAEEVMEIMNYSKFKKS